MRRLPPGWTTHGWPFAELYAGDHEDPEDHPGIWHVTTAAPKVLEAGKLMSRQQLGKTQGLGGGVSGVAADKVSVVTRPEDAQRLAKAMQIAALAAKDRLPAWVVAWETMQASNWFEVYEAAQVTLNMLYEWEEWGEKADQFEYDITLAQDCLAALWRGQLPWDRRTARAQKRQMDKRWSRAGGFQTRFDLLRAVEQCVNQLRTDVGEHDESALESVRGPVGFTTDWTNVEPTHVRVVRLAARKGAFTECVPVEGELRFDPKDLIMVGLESPRGLERAIRP